MSRRPLAGRGGQRVDQVGHQHLRGTGYEYFRNDAMDSIDDISKRAGAPKAKNKQNQYGGNIGGPIVKDSAVGCL